MKLAFSSRPGLIKAASTRSGLDVVAITNTSCVKRATLYEEGSHDRLRRIRQCGCSTGLLRCELKEPSGASPGHGF